MNNLISIIVPIYNAEKYLERCIQSIINQSYKNIEIILVNDGSIDKSQDIINQYQNIDNRIRSLYQTNKGVSIARNVGIDNSHGEWICFIDSDDYITSDFVKTLYQLVNEYKVDMATFSVNNNENDICIMELSQRQIMNFIIENKMIQGYPWNKMYNASIIKTNNIKFDSEIHICEDLLFCYEYIKHTHNAVYLRKKTNKLYYYQQHTDSVLGTKNYKKLMSSLKAIGKLINNDMNLITLKNISELKRMYAIAAMRSILYYWVNENHFNKDIYHYYLRLAKLYKGELYIKDRMIYYILRMLPHLFYIAYLLKHQDEITK